LPTVGTTTASNHPVGSTERIFSAHLNDLNGLLIFLQ
jgi:hypothetical protein